MRLNASSYPTLSCFRRAGYSPPGRQQPVPEPMLERMRHRFLMQKPERRLLQELCQLGHCSHLHTDTQPKLKGAYNRGSVQPLSWFDATVTAARLCMACTPLFIDKRAGCWLMSHLCWQHRLNRVANPGTHITDLCWRQLERWQLQQVLHGCSHM